MAIGNHNLYFNLAILFGVSGWITNVSYAMYQEHEDEFCDQDTFTARCPDNHVIEVTRATFGRMSLGRCAQNIIQSCDVDALPLLRHQCSGLARCHVEVSDIDKSLVNQTRQVCSQEYRLHLYSAYRCIPIETEPDQPCIISDVPSPITVTERHGYLASVTTRRTSKGSQGCPWHISGLPGQTIEIILHNFNSKVSASDSMCYIYASIRERALPDSEARLMDCGFRSIQGKVFHSLSESLDVIIVDPDENRNFVLEYRALGCPDVETSGGAEVVRKGNTTTIRCDDASWTLQCRDGEWYGERGECTVPVTQEESSFPWPQEWSQEFTVVLIIAVAILIAVVIVVIGICIVRRKTNRDFHSVPQNPGEYGVYNLRGPVAPSSKCYYPTLPLPPDSHCIGGSGSESSHYTTTMQRHQAVPAGFKTPSMDAFALHAPHLLQQTDLTSCASCPVHSGTYHDRVGASGWQTFPVRRPDHIYESPKAARRQFHDPPFYHELDPKEVERQLREQQRLGIKKEEPKSNGPVPAAIPTVEPLVPTPAVLPIPTEDEMVSDDDSDPLPPPPPPLPPDNPR